MSIVLKRAGKQEAVEIIDRTKIPLSPNKRSHRGKTESAFGREDCPSEKRSSWGQESSTKVYVRFTQNVDSESWQIVFTKSRYYKTRQSLALYERAL